ncbi:hypothetical protein Tco_1419747 [Tanacetum coccineum]
MRVSTNAPPPSSNSSSNFEFQQMAAALEDKMTLTFRNEMNEMKNMMKALVPTPVPIKSANLLLLLLWYLPLYLAIPSQTQGVKLEPLYTRKRLLTHQCPPIPPPLYDENEPLTEKETEVTKDKVLPSTKDIQPPVIQKSHDPVKPVSSPISPEPSSAQVDNSPPSKEPSKETKLHNPSRVEHEKKGENDNKQIQKFWEMFKKIHVDITLADALILMPKYQKMLKSLLSNKEKLNEMAKTPVSETALSINLKKLRKSLGSRTISSIPCLPTLQSTRMTLELANCSLCVPKGIARDVFGPGPQQGLIDVQRREELVIRDGMERIVFKPDGSQDKESIHMMDIYDDRVKDVCEPKNDDSPTSTIVDEFESLMEKIFNKKKNYGISSSDQLLDEKLVLKSLTKEELFIHLKKAHINKEDAHSVPIPRRVQNGKDCDFPLYDEEIISNEASSKISPKVDVKAIVSFFSQIRNCVRKWATNEFVKDNDEINHEVFKSDNGNDLGIHDNKEEEIAFLDGLLEDENFFETNDKKVESCERKTKEDFETKVEPKSKQELQVFHPDIEILDHFETTSYVGSDYVFYEDFSLVDIIFPVNIQGKVFDPGISHFEKDVFDDKSSKELAPSKALLTLDVFDPLHPPLMDFHERIKKDKKKQKQSKTNKKREKDKETRARVRNQPEITAGSARHSRKKSKVKIKSRG